MTVGFFVPMRAIIAAFVALGGLIFGLVLAPPADSQQNLPPVLATAARVDLVQGTAASMSFYGQDPEGWPVSYSLAGNPPGMTPTTDADGIHFSGTPLVVGDFWLTMAASDGSATASESVLVRVHPAGTSVAPVIIAPPVWYFTPGEYIELQLGGVHGNGLAIIHWGWNMPAGVSIDESTGRITGTPNMQWDWHDSTHRLFDLQRTSGIAKVNWHRRPAGSPPPTTTTVPTTTTTTAPPTTTTTTAPPPTTTTTLPPTTTAQPPTTTTRPATTTVRTTTTTTAPPTTTTQRPPRSTTTVRRTTTTRPSSTSSRQTTTTARPTTSRPATTAQPSTTRRTPATAPSTATTNPTTSFTTTTVTVAPALPPAQAPTTTEEVEQPREERSVVVSVPTTVPPPPPVGDHLDARDDSFLLPKGRHVLSVTRNDVRISEEDVLQITDVTGADPAVTLSVEGDTLVLETGEWSGELVLSYTVTDGETSEVATATVVVTDSAIAPISAASQRGSFDGYGDNNSPDPDRILPRLEVPNFLVLFGSLNLAMFSNPWLLGALFLPLVALWRSRRKSGWAEVTGVPRGEVALVDLAGSQAQLRHDADEIWVTGRRRRGLVEVHVFGGSGWMDPDLLKFTSP